MTLARLIAAFALLPTLALAQPAATEPAAPTATPAANAAPTGAPTGAAPGEAAPKLTIELNKLEPIPGGTGDQAGCRAYIVAVDEEGGPRVDTLRLDLVLFGTDGVISRRVALDVGPILPGRTQVRPFDLRGVPCNSIGQMLVNDTLICKVGGADQTDCLDRIATRSRVSAKLTK